MEKTYNFILLSTKTDGTPMAMGRFATLDDAYDAMKEEYSEEISNAMCDNKEFLRNEIGLTEAHLVLDDRDNTSIHWAIIEISNIELF